ncbi:hypothetical protein [Faecalicatena contorta]|uniref:hypothetical protein n=1 Tax=Faecalicatena contorta TaxID=39482 RepID=UPI001F41FAF5|nr:hypothetical protein [Faecalicatena contorta]
MILQNHIGRMPLLYKRADQFIQNNQIFRRNVDACSGFDQYCPVLPVSCSGPVKGFIQTTLYFLITAVTYKRSLVKFGAMIGFRCKVWTMGVAMITEPASSFTDWSKSTTNVFLFAASGMKTFIIW